MKFFRCARNRTHHAAFRAARARAHDGAIRQCQVEKPQAELVRLDTGVSSLVSHRLANPVDDPSRQKFGILAAGITSVTI
jgi:hypothetical protein